MADNTILPAGNGGDTIRDIDRDGVKTQVMALDIGGQTESLFTDEQAKTTNELLVQISDTLTEIAILLKGTLT